MIHIGGPSWALVPTQKDGPNLPPHILTSIDGIDDETLSLCQLSSDEHPAVGSDRTLLKLGPGRYGFTQVFPDGAADVFRSDGYYAWEFENSIPLGWEELVLRFGGAMMSVYRDPFLAEFVVANADIAPVRRRLFFEQCVHLPLPLMDLTQVGASKQGENFPY